MESPEACHFRVWDARDAQEGRLWGRLPIGWPMPHDRILALHPTRPSAAVRIRRDRYDATRAAILDALGEAGPLTLGALTETVAERLDSGLCTPAWYVRTVKLDLEARGALVRLASRPHRVRLA